LYRRDEQNSVYPLRLSAHDGSLRTQRQSFFPLPVAPPLLFRLDCGENPMRRP
jgi:hypothetical protein